MDPLTILGAVQGGIGAATEILKTLNETVVAAERAFTIPDRALATIRDVHMIRSSLVAFERLQENISSVPSDRLSYIPLEDAKNTLINCVASLDGLEDVLRPLTDAELDAPSLGDCLRKIMESERTAGLSKRVSNSQCSLALMLTIMHQ